MEQTSIAALGQDVYDRTITINGCSKTYAMTGWRIGFAAAPPAVAKAMSNFQDQVTSNPTSFAQKGATVAFGMDAAGIEASIQAIPGVKIPSPKGAFYAFPDVSSYLGGKYADDIDLAGYLLEEAKVAVVPGSVFEGVGHIRLSYATSRAEIERGVERIGEALSKLRA